MFIHQFVFICAQFFILSRCHFLADAEQTEFEDKAIMSLPLFFLEKMTQKDPVINKMKFQKTLLLLKPRFGKNRDSPKDFHESSPDISWESDNHLENFEINESIQNIKQEKFYHSDNGAKKYIFQVDAFSSDSFPFNYKINIPFQITSKKHSLSRRNAKYDDRNCKTFIRKIIDDNEKQSGDEGSVKSVIISRKCEYPEKNTAFQPAYDSRSIYNLQQGHNNDENKERRSFPNSYKKSSYILPSETETEITPKDPLKTDYIDRIFEEHFHQLKNFQLPSTFSNIDRKKVAFTKQRPEEKDAPEKTYRVQSYEYKYPEDDHRSAISKEKKVSYNYSPESPKFLRNSHHSSENTTLLEKPSKNKIQIEFKDEFVTKTPEIMRKTFEYYRKDNPKDEPNNHEYAEEYVQGNYRSFSTDYDSDRDDPK